MHFRKRQTMVDEQIAEIDKLNAVINAAERDMLKLRKVMLPALKFSISVLHATVVRTAAAQHIVPSELPDDYPARASWQATLLCMLSKYQGVATRKARRALRS